MEVTQHSQVHRFWDHVALWLEGGETHYLAPRMARDIAKQLVAYADNIEREPSFAKSRSGTTRISQ